MGAIANAHRHGAVRLAPKRARPATRIWRLMACRSGSVGPLLGMLVTVMVLCVGAVVDVGRWMQARTLSQKALSAAALAGVRMLQISGGDHALAIASARRTFEENLGAGLAIALDGLTFAVGPDDASFTAHATGSTPTTLLRIAGSRNCR